MTLRLLLMAALVAPAALAQDSRPEGGRPSRARDTGKPEKPGKDEDGKPEEEEISYTAIVGGDVHPVSGPVIRGGTVLLKNDEILKVGHGVAVPEGATVVEAHGKHVCPGFVAVAATGILGGGRSRGKEKLADRFDPFWRNMLMALSAGVTTAHEGVGGRGGGFRFIFGGGGTFGGSPTGQVGGTVAKLTYGTVEGYEVADPSGLFFTYAGNTGTQRRQTRELIGRARKHLEEKRKWVEGLMEGEKDAKKPKADKNVANWARVLEGELTAYTQAGERHEIEAVLELCEEHDLPVVICGAEEIWTVVPEVARRDVRVLIAPRGQGFDLWGRRTRPGRDPNVDAEHGWNARTCHLLAGAGVIWATLPQGGGIGLNGLAGRDVMALPMEAAFAVRGGVSNEEALRSITIQAAMVLGVDDRLGTLEPGKDADVLLMDREPLDYRSFVEKAWVNGRLAYDKATCPLWNHVPTDRSKGLGPWRPWGTWPWPGTSRTPGANGSGTR